MKKLLLLISFSLACSFVFAQETEVDSLFENIMIDTNYVLTDSIVGDYADYNYTDSIGSYVPPEALASTRSYQNEDPGGDKFSEDEWKKIVGEKDYEEKKPKEKK